MGALAVLCCGGGASHAAQQAGAAIHGTPGVATSHATARFGALASRAATPAPRPAPRPRATAAKSAPAGGLLAEAPAPRVAPSTAASPGPSSSFAALGDDGSTIPPDVNGAVGPNHVVTMLNSQVRIQDRSGAAIGSTISLAQFWAPVGGSPTPFDPHVMYDPYGQRWIAVAAANPVSGASEILVAVSQTTDPTGNWHFFAVDADPANHAWADYPSVGFNKDWIVVSVNLYSISRGAFVRSNIYAFDKANLYGGGMGLYTPFTDTSGGATLAPATTYSPTLSTMYLVEDWAGNAGGHGLLRMSRITGPVGSETLTRGYAFPSTTAVWHDAPPSVRFLPQSGTTARIDAGDARMLGCVYRNGAIWCVHDVFLPAAPHAATHSAVQWWQLTPGGRVLQRGRIGGATSPTDFAYGSIAVNRSNDALIGYSMFSPRQHPSAGYSFRSGVDPRNTVRGPVRFKAGAATYAKSFGTGDIRWGDFSSAWVDPVNDADLWTLQEYAAVPNGIPAGRWGTWWARLVRPPDVGVTVTDSADPVAANRSVTYTVKVTNHGPAPATAVVLTNTLPRNVVVDSTPAGCSGTGPYTCTIGTMPAGSVETFPFAVTPLGPRRMMDSASIAHGERDLRAVNNSARQVTVVRGAPGVSYLSVSDPGYSPTPLAVPLGNIVHFNFYGPAAHTATDPRPPRLFDAGAAPIGFAAARFPWAGVFAVHDQQAAIESDGRLWVSPRATPLSGGRATTFTITWGTRALPAGFVADVQRRAPGSRVWSAWKTGVTSLSGSFRDNAGPLGVWSFRARLRDTGTSTTYPYSTIRTISVHP